MAVEAGGDARNGTAEEPDIDDDLEGLGLSEEELDELLESDAPILGLTALLEPDDEMLRRVTASVEQRLADRAALATVAELLGLGWFTLRAVLGDQNAT